jgi:hypothetical protein
MPKRARQRQLQGRSPLVRRVPAWVGKRTDESVLVGPGWRIIAENLPALVVCPRCGRHQWADPDVLGAPRSANKR